MIVAVLILITVLAYYIAGEKMDVGSWADWVSALSTLGTLGIAYAAYRKAPDWLQPKIDEDVYRIAKELILINYRELAIAFSNSVVWIETINPDVISVLSKAKTDFLQEEKNKAKLLLKIRKSIETNIIHLDKLGYKLNPQVQTHHIEFMNSTHTLITYVMSYWYNINKTEGNITFDIEHLHSIYPHIKKLHNELEAQYDLINNFSAGIMSYFERK